MKIKQITASSYKRDLAFTLLEYGKKLGASDEDLYFASQAIQKFFENEKNYYGVYDCTPKDNLDIFN